MPINLAAGYSRTIPDVIAPDLTVLFCGINPGLYSAAIGCHFGRPGNRFWPALYKGGFTPRQLHPTEQAELLDYGLGITNLVERATARADELTRDELQAGADVLITKVQSLRPAWLAVLGVGAYRTAFGVPTTKLGPQPKARGGAQAWVLPNPSGLNAHFSLDQLAAQFAALRGAADH